MITSLQNPKIKRIRALAARVKERRESGMFVVEGVRLIEEAVKENWTFETILYDSSASERGEALIANLRTRSVDVEEVSTEAMKSLSETETPQGVLAVLRFSPLPLAGDLNFILIADRIRDPGNLGTLLRSAAATGAQAVLIPPETTDAFAPKVLRSGMGAHFRLPIRETSWEEIERTCKSTNVRVFLADMGGRSCWEVDLRQPLALIVGGEAEGASAQARKLAEERIGIPMAGNVESLNAGVAGSILMFEAVRQRRCTPQESTRLR
ncbi:MAG: RNA methyltransferase [Anaerolineales bacterium]|nr:RNA methyltransferase [Anaerolineales bacterium]MCL4261089.1 RNA methyltransferase [Anaerolineales bacterium]